MDGILNDTVVFPLTFVIEKSPWVIISMPISIPKFRSSSVQSTTLTGDSAILLGKNMLIRYTLRREVPPACFTCSKLIGRRFKCLATDG